MKNAMQLKAVMKNIAREKHISAQLVMQNYIIQIGLCGNSGIIIERTLNMRQILLLRMCVIRL